MSSKIKTAWHSSRTSRTAKDELSVVLDFSQNLDVPNDLKEKPGPGPTCNYYYSSHGHGKNCSDILASSINGKSGKDTWVEVDLDEFAEHTKDEFAEHARRGHATRNGTIV